MRTHEEVGPTTSESRRKTKNLKMFFVDDGRRLLLSKQATAPHSEKIATECPKLKFSIEKIKKVNLSKKTGVRRSAKPMSAVNETKRNNITNYSLEQSFKRLQIIFGIIGKKYIEDITYKDCQRISDIIFKLPVRLHTIVKKPENLKSSDFKVLFEKGYPTVSKANAIKIIPNRPIIASN